MNIEVATINDFHKDDLNVANERFRRLKKSFILYSVKPPDNLLNIQWSITIDELPDMICLSLGINRREEVFYFTVGESQHRFLVNEFDWNWVSGECDPFPREQLYEEVMEFINDYSE